MKMGFRKPKKAEKRLKALIYGPTASLKTRTALSCPSPVVFDFEKGTVHYSNEFEFQLADGAVERDKGLVISELRSLAENPGEFKTLVIDPISELNDIIHNDYTKKLRAKTGNDDYALQPMDFKVTKAHLKTIIDLLLLVDMNVIVTAREKALYAEGEFMRRVGTTFDGPPNFDHYFDTVLHVFKDNGVCRFETIKDRTHSFPADETPEFSYDNLARYFGIENLERRADSRLVADSIQKENQRTFKTSMKGQEVYTAGIEGKTINKIIDLKMEEDNLANLLTENFFKSSVLDLTADEGEAFYKMLKTNKPNIEE